MSNIAVVILNWNGRSMLERYLSNVINFTQGDADIYVADNASTDDSVEWVKQHHPNVHLILLSKNWGFAEGYNKALRQVDAKYYVLLNSDVEVTHHWLTPLVEMMEAHEDIAACQPKLLSMADKGAFEYAGACGGFLDKYGYPFCRGRVFETVEADNGQYDNAAEVLWATGACLVIRSADYWSVGGLDGRFFAHFEEIDLCWRLHNRGRKIFCFPDSVVYHVGGGTLPKNNPMKTYLNFRNNLTMLYKNLPDSRLNRVMRMRCCLDYIAACKCLFVDRNIGEFKAILRGRRDFLRWRKDFYADRLDIQRASVASHSISALQPFSILWQYYAKGRRHFSDFYKKSHYQR